MGMIKDRSGKDLTEAEEIKKRWQEYTEDLYPHPKKKKKKNCTNCHIALNLESPYNQQGNGLL